MNLYAWAARHGVSNEAVRDLMVEMGCSISTPLQSPNDAVSESGASQRIRLAYARAGGILWRNNVGAMQDDNGRVVRYGLANESKQMNKEIKSSDLIGVMPVEITQAMVGQVIGQFVAREVKKPGWVYSGTEREQAQWKYIQLVLSLGGDAGFTCGE